MKTISFDPSITQPRTLYSDGTVPPILGHCTDHELCRLAGIPMRVTGSKRAAITLVAGREHYQREHAYWVGVGRTWKPTRIAAIRVLEILAYGFHDYVARECVNPERSRLFHAPKPMGRPLAGLRPMSAKQRMAAMRARRRAADGHRSQKRLREAYVESTA